MLSPDFGWLSLAQLVHLAAHLFSLVLNLLGSDQISLVAQVALWFSSAIMFSLALPISLTALLFGSVTVISKGGF